jgi:membrane-associated PAP2 superfamily phosphatase
VIFLLLSLNPIVLVKSFAVVFSLQQGKCFPGGRVSEGHVWDGAPWGQLLVN